MAIESVRLITAHQRSCWKVMFPYVSISPHVTITYDTLDLTVQGSIPTLPLWTPDMESPGDNSKPLVVIKLSLNSVFCQIGSSSWIW